MAYSESVLKRARARLEQAKAEREAENEAHLAQAYEKYPRLREIDRALRLTAAQAMAAAFRKEGDPAQQIRTLREKNLELQREREWILDAAEFEDGFLDNTPVCELCGGSGYIGSEMCTCLKELCCQEQRKELTSLFLSGRESFENFSLQYYPDAYDAKLGTSPRKLMQLTLSYCRRYAAGFSRSSESLLFSGATGLGKTFLSACIARQVANRSFSVVYETAVRVFGDFETARFGERSEENRNLTRKYLTCDLLILDDLGTEMTTQFTISALYTLVNTRLIESRPTILSTNLLPESLEGRYSPQIASRLQGDYRLFQFYGSDIRLQKKEL
jgi:DNA replication protein DnaC